MSHTSQDRQDRSWFHRQPTLLPGRPVHPAMLYRGRALSWGFFMWMTFALYALYVVRDAGLSPLQLLLVGVVLEASVAAFELPTGLIADTVSRRLSVICGTLITGVGWAVMGLHPSFETVIAGQFLFGVGFTFISGANEAWLADEIGETEAACVYPQAAQWTQAARIAGVLCGAGLALLHPTLPFLAGGAGNFLVALVLLGTMTERGWRPTPAAERSGLGEMRAVLAAATAVARRSRMVRAAIGIALLVGGSSEAFDRLWGYHLLEGVGVSAATNETILFGAIAIASQVGGFIVIAVGRRLTSDGSRESVARLLSAIYTAAVIVPLAFAFTPAVGIAVALVTLHQWTAAAESPFFTAWVNRGLDPRTRATVLSGIGQANSIGQVLSGLLFALLATTGGVTLALVVGALLVAPAAFLARTTPEAAR